MTTSAAVTHALTLCTEFCLLTLQKQEAQFKAAELEFHQQQLQHVSEEQRQAEELIQISLDQNGGG